MAARAAVRATERHARPVTAWRATHAAVSAARPMGIAPSMDDDASEDRRSGRDRDWTDAEREGQPATEDQPPGIGPETAQEGSPLPSDHPLGSEERGATQQEEARPESVRDRSARLRPDAPQAPPDDAAGRLVDGATDDGDEPSDGEWSEDAGGVSAEEAAGHVEEG